MAVRVRFAPSPTGWLHIGNARIALANWLFARHAGGRALLRLDDTDAERSDPAYAAGIEEDLAWLGLDWDERAAQSDRMDRYRTALDVLAAAGRAYPCYETPEELALKRRRLSAAGKPPIYDRAALDLGAADRAALEAEGRKPHWRFKLDHEPIAWTDLVRGPVQFDGADLSDPVIVRADGAPLYTLTSCVDDVELAVSHVIRGEDHVANTAAQLQLIGALGGDAAAMSFVHLPLLRAADGGGLSKRLGSLALRDLRAEGIEPLAIVSLLAFLGTAEAIDAAPNMEALVEGFGFDRFSRAAPRFDPAELDRLNRKVIHAMDWEEAAPRLTALGLDHADAAFWDAVRGNLDRLADTAQWHTVCFGEVTPQIEDVDFAAAAAGLLPPAPWDGATWKAWTSAVKQATGRSGKALYLPLRLALTGAGHGPELGDLLPLIGPDRAHARLSGKAA